MSLSMMAINFGSQRSIHGHNVYSLHINKTAVNVDLPQITRDWCSRSFITASKTRPGIWLNPTINWSTLFRRAILIIVINACYTLGFESVRILHKSLAVIVSSMTSNRSGSTLTRCPKAIAAVFASFSLSTCKKMSNSSLTHCGVASILVALVL